MINYYQELKLDRGARLSDINKQLLELERIWLRRELVNPEKADKMKVLITEAKKVFQSEELRKSYDNKLDSGDEEDKKDNRQLSFEKWKESAGNFLETGEYDLAYSAVERALNYLDSDNEDDDFFNLVAQICGELKEFEKAISYINKAIVISPNFPMHYIIKGKILEEQAFTLENYNEGIKLIDKSRELFRTAIIKADKLNDHDMSGKARGILAFSLYYSRKPDVVEAESVARKALIYGDDWGNSQKVIHDIDRIREEQGKEELIRKQEEERIREENLRHEEEKREAERIESEKRAVKHAELEAEREELRAELDNLKGVFSRKRRTEIERRLNEIFREILKL